MINVVPTHLCSSIAKVLTTAASLVQYCKDQPMIREVPVNSHSTQCAEVCLQFQVTQAKYLAARTLWRGYYHITKDLVLENGQDREREVERLEGTKSYCLPIYLYVSLFQELIVSNRPGALGSPISFWSGRRLAAV